MTDELPPCPYCQAVLPKRPQRKSKCPHCGSAILVRTGKRVLMTEAQAAQHDAKLAAEYAMRAIEARVESFGMKKAEFESRRTARPELPSADIISKDSVDVTICPGSGARRPHLQATTC